MVDFSVDAAGPSIAEINDYEFVTVDEAEEEEDKEPHPAAETMQEFGEDIALKKTEKSAVRFFRGIKPMIAWMDLEKDIENPINASEDEVKDYVKWLINTDWAVNSRKNRVSACQRFYKWAKKEGPLDEHLADDVELEDYNIEPGALEESRGDIEDYKWIKRDKVVQLWQPENLPSPSLRSELLIKLMWFTTCRCEAISKAKWKPNDPDKGLNREEGKLRVRNLKKGDNQDSHRWVYYPKERIEPLLQQWLEQGRREASSPYASESEYLFLTRQKKFMRPSYISRIVKDAGHNAGINEVIGYDVHGNPRWLVTGHCIRHSSITYLANHTDMELHVLKKQAGHSKYDTTLKYVHDEPDVRRKAINEAWGTE